MRGALEEARAAFNQAGNKGWVLETECRKVLKQFLPPRFQIGHGEITDSFDNSTGQVDVIIADQHHPQWLTADGLGRFLFDSVKAVDEVKAILGAGELQDSIERSRQFRQLVPISAEGDVAIGVLPENVRFWCWRPNFICAFESPMTLGAIHQRLEAEANAHGQILDAVFVLDKGWVIDAPTDDGLTELEQPPVAHWVGHPSGTLVFDWLTWLSSVMPETIGRRPILSSYWKIGPHA